MESLLRQFDESIPRPAGAGEPYNRHEHGQSAGFGSAPGGTEMPDSGQKSIGGEQLTFRWPGLPIGFPFRLSWDAIS